MKIKLWLCVYLIIAAGLAVRVSVRQIRPDVSMGHGEQIFVPLEADEFENSPPERQYGPAWKRAYLWELGTQEDGSFVQLYWIDFAIKEGALLLLAVVFRDVITSAIMRCAPAIRKRLVLAPLALYSLLALHMAVFVPCIVELPRYGGGVRRVGRILWVLDVRNETIRYDLIAYKEILLLGALVLTYALVLSFSPTLRYKLRRWIDDWRQPWVTR